MDYANPRIRDFRNVTQYTSPMVDRKTIPRMPWHDVHCVLYGASARDCARHFIQRWNFIKQQKAMHKQLHIPFLLPKPDFTPEQLVESQVVGSAIIQLVRSSCEWSMGMQPETSCYDSMLHYIREAKHFIFIENQFFISRSSDSQMTPVKNRIATAIMERILRAHETGSTFRVIIFLPLLPAFESPVHRAEASSVRMIMQGQYSAISKGPHSILGQLKARGIPAERYISFFSLRKHGILGGKHVTEQLYIHSKLMIVDDRVAILGSTNINDRSLLGVRDSELAVIVEDAIEVDITFNGVPFKAAKCVRDLRIRLFREHLGLLSLPDDDPAVLALSDPVCDEFYHGVLRRQASVNTQIYRELFHCLPDDVVDSWEEYKRFTEVPKVFTMDETLGQERMANLNLIKGSIVLFPTEFLCKEDLVASMLSPEFLLPIEVYL